MLRFNEIRSRKDRDRLPSAVQSVSQSDSGVNRDEEELYYNYRMMMMETSSRRAAKRRKVTTHSTLFKHRRIEGKNGLYLNTFFFWILFSWQKLWVNTSKKKKKERLIENDPLDWLCFFPSEEERMIIINETCYWTVHQIKCVRYSQSKWKIFAAKMKWTSNSFHPINQTFKSVKLIWIRRQWTVWWWRRWERQRYTHTHLHCLAKANWMSRTRRR